MSDKWGRPAGVLDNGGDFLVCRKLVVENETGLHLRPAGALVGEASRFDSRIMLTHGEYQMNCKSLMSLLAHPLCPGDEVVLECDGADEEQAAKKIYDFLINLREPKQKTN